MEKALKQLESYKNPQTGKKLTPEEIEKAKQAMRAQMEMKKKVA